MPINRAPWTALIDDDGSNLVGTVWNKDAIKTVLLDPIDGMAPNYVTVAATGTQHNLACGPANAITVLDCVNGTDLILTGVTFTTPPRPGDLLLLQARGEAVWLAHASGSSTQKFHNLAKSAPTPLAPRSGCALYTYIGGSYWLMVQHDQGAWIAPPFNAAHFAAGGSMTWTVTAGQVVQAAFCLTGTTVQYSLYVAGAVLGGTAHGILYYTPPGGFTCRGPHPVIASYYGGSQQAILVGLHDTGLPRVTLIRDAVATPFPLGAVSVYLTGTVDVT